MVVTLPAALLIWHWWRRQRVTSTDLLRLAPFFVAALVLTVTDLAYYTSREPLDLGYSLGRAAADRLPRPLVLRRQAAVAHGTGGHLPALGDPRRRTPWLGRTWRRPRRCPPCCGWAGIALGLGPLAAALFYAVTLSPVLGFVDYGYMQFAFVADRFPIPGGHRRHGRGHRRRGLELQPGCRKLFTNRPAARLLAAVLALLGALTWVQAGIYRNEVTFFSHIVSLNPRARDAYLNLGGALFEEQRFEEGIAASRLAVEQRPDSAKAHTNLGRGLMKREQLDEAHRHIRRALELDPRGTSALQNMGELLRKRKRYREAVESYRKVLRIQRWNELAYGGMGMALFELKRYEEAAGAMAKALSLKPDLPGAPALRLFLGRALQALGRLGEADEQFRLAVEAEPGDPQPLLELANLRMEQKRPQEAARHLDRARELSSGNPALLHAVAETLRRQRRLPDAIASYRAAIDLDPGYAPPHAGLGIALFESERHAEAVEAMARALRLQPDLPVAGSLHLFTGRALQSLGRPEAAAESYERAAAVDPRGTEPLDRLAMMRFEQKRYERGSGDCIASSPSDRSLGRADPRQPRQPPCTTWGGPQRRSGASNARSPSIRICAWREGGWSTCAGIVGADGRQAGTGAD